MRVGTAGALGVVRRRQLALRARGSPGRARTSSDRRARARPPDSSDGAGAAAAAPPSDPRSSRSGAGGIGGGSARYRLAPPRPPPGPPRPPPSPVAPRPQRVRGVVGGGVVVVVVGGVVGCGGFDRVRWSSRSRWSRRRRRRSRSRWRWRYRHRHRSPRRGGPPGPGPAWGRGHVYLDMRWTLHLASSRSTHGSTRALPRRPAAPSPHRRPRVGRGGVAGTPGAGGRGADRAPGRTEVGPEGPEDGAPGRERTVGVEDGPRPWWEDRRGSLEDRSRGPKEANPTGLGRKDRQSKGLIQ